MKKLLVGIAALSIGAQAQADVSFSGDSEVRYQNRANNEGVKDANTENYRMWTNLYVDGSKGENVGFRLQLRHVTSWGRRIGVEPSAADTATGRTQQDDLLFVQEAVATVKTSDNGSLIFGRSGLDLNNGELVSKQTWADSRVAFDGIRYLHDADWGRLGLSYSVTGDDNSLNATQRNNIKFRGLSYTFKNMPSAISNLELHYVNAMADGATLPTLIFQNAEERTWIGANIAGEVAGVDYRVNVENFTGKNNADADLKAMMMDIEVGYRLNWMDSRVYLGYHDDGATSDSMYDPLFYDFHNYSGRMDIVAWGNLNEISLGYEMKPTAASVLGLSYHQFSRSSSDHGVTLFSGQNSNDITTTAVTDDDIGSEINLWYSHNYDSGLKLNAELGQFMPGDAWGANDETISYLFVGAGIDF